MLHLQSLRRFQHSGGWIRALLEEAENERMHLMIFMEVSRPSFFERMLVTSAQAFFIAFYAVLYGIAPKTAHRIVGYLEEEACRSYSSFLKEIDEGRIANIPAPLIAIDYYRLRSDATLRDVVQCVRADEADHRDVNHFKANMMHQGNDSAAAPLRLHEVSEASKH